MTLELRGNFGQALDEVARRMGSTFERIEIEKKQGTRS